MTRSGIIPDALIALIGICLVAFAVLDLATLEAHGAIVAVAGAVIAALGIWANRLDYLKWPGMTAAIAGIAIVILVLSGVAAKSSEATFWVVLWSGNAVGVVSLWSAFYRGPAASA